MKKVSAVLIFTSLTVFLFASSNVYGETTRTSDSRNLFALTVVPGGGQDGDLFPPAEDFPDVTSDDGSDDTSTDASNQNAPTNSQASAENDSGEGFTDFKSAVKTLTGYINLLIPLLIGVGVLFFIWGLLKYLSAGGDEAQLAEAKKFIIFGVVGLAVMISVWGLVNLVVSAFFPDTGMFLPQIKT